MDGKESCSLSSLHESMCPSHTSKQANQIVAHTTCSFSLPCVVLRCLLWPLLYSECEPWCTRGWLWQPWREGLLACEKQVMCSYFHVYLMKIGIWTQALLCILISPNFICPGNLVPSPPFGSFSELPISLKGNTTQHSYPVRYYEFVLDPPELIKQ